MDYSQNKEQEVICTFFKNKGTGTFLDVGAFDGVKMSNTMRLAELGWGGVCVEASRTVFPALYETHKYRKKIILANYALSEHTGEVCLHDSNGDGASTMVDKLRDQWQAGGHCKFTDMMVKSISAIDLLIKYGNFFNFVNIDTEWTSAENLFRLINAGLKFDLLCVEHDDKPDSIIRELPERLKEHSRNKINLFIQNRETICS